MSVEYCPTGQMLADFFTKPLQGTPLHIFWDDIMGLAPQLTLTMDHRSVLGLDTADSGNSDNDGAQDDSGWIALKWRGKMS